MLTFAPAMAVEKTNTVAEFVYKNVPQPKIGAVGGEWAVIGLARSGAQVPQSWYDVYYNKVRETLREKNGVLHEKKYTEYSRVVLALTAIGKNPADVDGYNLLEPLADFDKTVWQGVNGAIFALIALDCNNYPSQIREKYVNYILEKQASDGGWALSGNTADPDITGMALQALFAYRNDEKVNRAIEKALLCMSEMQDGEGGFSAYGMANSESCVQMIVALCTLNIPLEDARFVKNGKTILDNLNTYYVNGGFKHTASQTSADLMASEQGLYCLAALGRFKEGKNSLYNMTDVKNTGLTEGTGLETKHPDVKKMPVVFEGKTFEDTANDENRLQIEALAERNIINGKTETLFEPNATMTRAEFAAIMVKGLGLPFKKGKEFSDVTENDWFYDYVNTAQFYGIVNGVSEKEFNPMGTITRQEAAVMAVRGAKLCGMNTTIEIFEAKNILAGFIDYVKAEEWAIPSLAFVYKEGLLPDDALEIKPNEAVTRSEIALILYNLLKGAFLL